MLGVSFQETCSQDSLKTFDSSRTTALCSNWSFELLRSCLLRDSSRESVSPLFMLPARQVEVREPLFNFKSVSGVAPKKVEFPMEIPKIVDSSFKVQSSFNVSWMVNFWFKLNTFVRASTTFSKELFSIEARAKFTRLSHSFLVMFGLVPGSICSVVSNVGEVGELQRLLMRSIVLVKRVAGSD